MTTAEVIEDEDAVAWVLNNLALLYSRTGEREKEERALDRALGLPEETRRVLVSSDGVPGFVPFALPAPECEVAYAPS